jgi:hypothetical protein
MECECLDESIPLLKDISSLLRQSSFHPSMGFMTDSLLAFIKAYQVADGDVSMIDIALNQYANCLANYVRKKTGIVRSVRENGTSLISAVGPDLCEMIVSFADSYEWVNFSLVCKTFNKVVAKIIWKNTTMCASNGHSILKSSFGPRLSINSPNISLMHDFTLALSHRLPNCWSGFIPKLKSLKSLHFKFHVWIPAEIEKALSYFEDLVATHLDSLLNLSIVVSDFDDVLCTLQQSEKFFRMLPSSHLESFSLSLACVETVYNCFPNTLIGLLPHSLKYLSFVNCSGLVNFFNLSPESVHFKDVVLDGDTKELFRMLSSVSILFLHDVSFKVSESLLHSFTLFNLKEVTLVGNADLILAYLKCLPSLESMEIRNGTLESIPDHWSSYMLPKLRDLNIFALGLMNLDEEMSTVREKLPELQKIRISNGWDLLTWSLVPPSEPAEPIPFSLPQTLEQVSSYWSEAEQAESKKRKLGIRAIDWQ